MYEELIESCRACATGYNTNCDRCMFCGKNEHGEDSCFQKLHRASADAIEELQKRVPKVPHGDSIDRAALWVEINKICDRRDAGIISDLTCLQQILSALRHAPTIIPEDHIGDADQMVNNDYAGLKVKYIVRKASNGELVDDCFVLRPDKDQDAIAALNAYADATENQVLAADIRKWLSSIISAEPRVIKWREWNRIGAEEGET